ncbi:hypothetical protein CDAR_33271 [Caerostris darwini]|uniref:Cytochrome c oxidase subunit 1 n=1 Tax=Caerostris darwini TaxID=1538125 RepID=A0AAV4X1T8_9ARAC|nr:hypothetical protein CDAR_33271 [Caerostris darwini]
MGSIAPENTLWHPFDHSMPHPHPKGTRGCYRILISPLSRRPSSRLYHPFDHFNIRQGTRGYLPLLIIPMSLTQGFIDYYRPFATSIVSKVTWGYYRPLGYSNGLSGT